MYRTPRFYSLIDEVSQVLCLNEGKLRKRALSESRTFDHKQVCFSDFLSQLSHVLGCEKSEISYLTTSFLKVENILSDLANVPIYSNVPSEIVERYFYSKYTSFFIVYLIEELSKRFESLLFSNLNSIFFYNKDNVINRDSVIIFIKNVFNDDLKIKIKDKDATSELSIFISKLNNRSFPKIKTIEELLSECFPNEGDNDIKYHVKSWFLAAKIAFNLSKISESYIDADHFVLDDKVKMFLGDYVFDDSIDESDFNFLNDENYKEIKSDLLCFLGQKDPVDFLKTHGTKELLKHDNQVFFSYFIREQIFFEINKFFVEYRTINVFEGYLDKLKKRQSGKDGTDIAVFLLTSELKFNKKIPQNSLQPYLSLLCDNLRTEKIEFPIVYSPFGYIDLSTQSMYDINLAYAVRSFNALVQNRTINSYYCNPLYQLDCLMKKILLGKNLTSKDFRVKPIKGFNETIFDSLVKIDFYLLSFGLQVDTGIDYFGRVFVKTSIAGSWINKFIKLSEIEKKSILKSLSPEEYKVSELHKNDIKSLRQILFS